jgi:BolA protein
MSATRERIEAALTARFAPQRLEVVDESHLHAGWRQGGETHFRVTIVAGAFDGASRLARHRMVNEALAAELAGGVHALAIRAQSPAEAG